MRTANLICSLCGRPGSPDCGAEDRIIRNCERYGAGVPASIPWSEGARALVFVTIARQNLQTCRPRHYSTRRGSPSGRGQRSAHRNDGWNTHAAGACQDRYHGMNTRWVEKLGRLSKTRYDACWAPKQVKSGISVMGQPDKKLTDGNCARWEKKRMDRGTALGRSMLQYL